MTIFKFIPHVFALLLATLIINTAALAENDSKSESPSESNKEFIELQPEDFKPTFTKETVLKLNAIVRKSYDAINEYDGVIKGIRASVDQAVAESASNESKLIAQEDVDNLGDLAKRSMDASAEMTEATTKLKNSDEIYNPAVLHGMIDFVEDVEREITSEYKELSALLNGQLD